MKLIQSSKHLTQRSTAACANCFRKLVAGIGSAKRSLAAEFRNQFGPAEHLLHLALNEAEALAWQTNYPHLVFPTLAVEKARSVLQWSAHQQTIQQRNNVHSPTL
jgi:hypothetical protein